MEALDKIGFGGGCHWCTEAVFQHLRGVQKVAQGWIASDGKHGTFSEAVIVHFDTQMISMDVLIAVHLYTHNSTSNHSMRTKYRSAVYTFSEKQSEDVKGILMKLQNEFEQPLITAVLPFVAFKPSADQFVDYYRKNPRKPFCQNHIDPKLKLLLKKFDKHVFPLPSIAKETSPGKD